MRNHQLSGSGQADWIHKTRPNKFILRILGFFVLQGALLGGLAMDTTSEGTLQELNRRIAMNSSDATAYGERADWWLTQDRENPMVSSGDAVTSGPDDPTGMGSPDEPREALRKALQDIKSALLLDTGNSLFYCILGEIYTRLGLISEADDALRVSMARNPELVRVYLRRGELALINRQHGVAFKYLNEALRRDKRLAEGYLLKGLTYLELKDTAAARSAWLTAIEQDPNLYAAYLELGLREKDPQTAHRYFSNVLQLKPAHVEACYARGMLLQAQGYLDSARQDYRNLLKVRPQHRDALFNMAYLDMLDKNFDEAITGYDKVLALDAQDLPAMLNRGLCYELMGKVKEAAADYKECLRLRKGYPQALQGLNRLK
ncbi:MAG: tetratricopeptide repeat protein [Bacteroidota bacterium]